MRKWNRTVIRGGLWTCWGEVGVRDGDGGICDNMEEMEKFFYQQTDISIKSKEIEYVHNMYVRI